MPNTYFSFKEFTVHQDKCAMKVCTDACLFGAWTANFLFKNNMQLASMLDIGTGTGLLSLMLAQKVNANIDALEIDEDAAMQARQNFQDSPWNEQLKLYNIPVQDFKTENKYDLIISNPPFFINDLKSEDEKRNKALHTTTLNYNELVGAVKNLLADDGFFAVLLPFSNAVSFIEIAETQKLYLHRKIDLRQTERHTFFRSVLVFSNLKKKIQMNAEITIKNGADYTKEFAQLLSDYYLKL